MFPPPARKIFVQNAKAPQKIPISLLSFLTLYQIIFGFKFGCTKVMPVKFQKAALRLSIFMGCLMISTFCLTFVAPAEEGNGDYWKLISLIQYIPTFFILISAEYTVFEFLSDLMTHDTNLIGWVACLYTSLVFMLKMTGAVMYCGLTVCTDIRKILIQFFLHVPMLALDVIPVVNSLLFYHVYIQTRNLKIKLLDYKITLQQFEADFKAVADRFDKFRAGYDAMFMWGFLMDFPKLMLVLWNHLRSLKTYKSWLMKSSTYVYAVHATVQICIPAVFAEMINAQTDEIKMILHERLLMEKDAASCGRLLRYLEARPLVRKACRLLPLDLRLPVTMLSMCATYLIVIIQFTHLSKKMLEMLISLPESTPKLVYHDAAEEPALHIVWAKTMNHIVREFGHFTAQKKEKSIE